MTDSTTNVPTLKPIPREEEKFCTHCCRWTTHTVNRCPYVPRGPRIGRLGFVIGAIFAGTYGLGGCAKEPEPTVVVKTRLVTPKLAPECTASDPGWVDLPDADARRSAAARNYVANKTAYSDLLARRRVCRASIVSRGKSKS